MKTKKLISVLLLTSILIRSPLIFSAQATTGGPKIFWDPIKLQYPAEGLDYAPHTAVGHELAYIHPDRPTQKLPFGLVYLKIASEKKDLSPKTKDKEKPVYYVARGYVRKAFWFDPKTKSYYTMGRDFIGKDGKVVCLDGRIEYDWSLIHSRETVPTRENYDNQEAINKKMRILHHNLRFFDTPFIKDSEKQDVDLKMLYDTFYAKPMTISNSPSAESESTANVESAKPNIVPSAPPYEGDPDEKIKHEVNKTENAKPNIAPSAPPFEDESEDEVENAIEPGAPVEFFTPKSTPKTLS